MDRERQEKAQSVSPVWQYALGSGLLVLPLVLFGLLMGCRRAPIEVTITPTPPTLTMTPASGPVEMPVQLFARGFPPTTTLQVYWRPRGGKAQDIIEVTTDPEGRAEFELYLPASAQPGESWIVGLADVGRDYMAESEAFRVTEIPAPF